MENLFPDQTNFSNNCGLSLVDCGSGMNNHKPFSYFQYLNSSSIFVKDNIQCNSIMSLVYVMCLCMCLVT